MGLLLLDDRLGLGLLLFFGRILFGRLKHVIFTQPQVTIFIAAAPEHIPILSQEQSESVACRNFLDVHVPQLLDLHREWLLLVVTHSQLPHVVGPPRVVRDLVPMPAFSNGVVSSALHIFHMADGDPVECQTILDGVAFADSAASGGGLGLASAVNPVVDEDDRVVGATSDLLNGFVLVGDVDFGGEGPHWLVNGGRHLLAPLVVVVACEINCPIMTVGEKGVIVPSCHHINWILKLHAQRYALSPSAAKGSLVVASHREYLAVGCEDHRMQSSTGDLQHCFVEERVGDGLLLFLILIVALNFVEGELWDGGETYGPARVGGAVGEPKLVGFPTAIDVKVEILDGEVLGLRLLARLLILGLHVKIIYCPLFSNI